MTAPLFAPVDIARETRADGSILLRSRDSLADYAPRITDWLWHWAEHRPDREFVVERGVDGAWRGMTYAQAADTVRRMAQAMLDRNLGPARPVAVLSGNSVRHAMVAFAAQAIGVPYAAVSEPYSLQSADLGKLRHILGKLCPALLFAEDTKKFARALSVPEAERAEAISGADLATRLSATPSAALDRAVAAVDPDVPVKILFTSGSTGVPKGVLATHRMMAANQQMILQVWPFLAEEPPELLDWLPWSHVFGCSHNLNMVLRFGGTFRIDAGRPMPGLFDITLANLRDTTSTIRFDVPRGHGLLLPALEADPDLARRVFSRMRVLFTAGAALPEPQFRRLQALAATHAPRPVPVVSSWGLTETAPAVTTTHGGDIQPAAIGTPLPGAELKLVPADGKLEIRVRGPMLFPGYLDEPGANAEAFDDEGFFRTGDAVTWIDPADPNQGLRFDGRLAEDFKLLSGTRINALELRLRLLYHLTGLVRDVVVVGSDRDDVGLLVFPADPSVALSAPYRDAVRAALSDANDAAGGGSSRRVARATILADPPSLDAGEVTDKGSLNVRTIQARRQAAIVAMYAGEAGAILLG